jgi:hypothetical protein
MRTFKNSSITVQATVLFVALVSIYLLGVAAALAANKDRPAYFLPEERKIIYEYYHRGSPSKGLPPGLAKKGKLPPGLQKHLDKNGKLPPGLQKRCGFRGYPSTGKESFFRNMSFLSTGALSEY